MNERIKQLAEQAGLTWRVQPLHYTNTNNPIDFPVSANRDLEKFAELIVQECLFIIDDERKPEMVSRIELWKQVKEHFGVEE
jgi:hypothetical protein